MTDEGQDTGTETNDVVERSVAEVLAENRHLKGVLAEKDAVINNLSTRLEKAESMLDDQVRSVKIDRIQKVSNLGIETLVKMSTEELANTEELYKYAKTPKFQSSGDLGGAHQDPFEKLHTMFKFGKRKR